MCVQKNCVANNKQKKKKKHQQQALKCSVEVVKTRVEIVRNWAISIAAVLLLYCIISTVAQKSVEKILLEYIIWIGSKKCLKVVLVDRSVAWSFGCCFLDSSRGRSGGAKFKEGSLKKNLTTPTAAGIQGWCWQWLVAPISHTHACMHVCM